MFLIFSSLIICFLCVLFWKGQERNEPPEVLKKWPLIGHLHLFLGSNEKLFKAIIALSNECEKLGGVVRADLCVRTIYMVTDPDDCITVGNACIQKDIVYDMTKSFLGEGLLTAKGTTWKRHRKLLNPAFNQHMLNNFLGIFNSQSRALVELFKKEVGKAFNHEHLLRISNLEIICATTSGMVSEEYRDLKHQYLKTLSEAMRLVMIRFKSLWLYIDFIYKISLYRRKEQNVVNKMISLSTSMIQKKKKDFTDDTKEMQSNDHRESGQVNSFLGYILELNEKMKCFTDEEVREELDTIIAAGHDTTAGILTTALILIGTHQEVQEKVYDEIRKVLGDADADVSKDNLTELVYMEAVLKETMRLYPVIPFNARFIEKEIKLKNYTLKPGRGVFLSMWSLHHNPMWGPDYEQFRPGRWLTPENLPDMAYYVAFGIGRRSCIGKVYAMMSMKITLAHIIRKFKMYADIKKVVWRLDILSKISDDDHLVIEMREN